MTFNIVPKLNDIRIFTCCIKSILSSSINMQHVAIEFESGPLAHNLFPLFALQYTTLGIAIACHLSSMVQEANWQKKILSLSMYKAKV